MTLTSKIINIQVAFFVKDKLEYPEAFGEKIIQSNLVKYFDKKPVIQSFPDIPPFADAPIVTVERLSETSQLTISRGRSDIYISGRNKEISAVKKEALEKAKNVYEFLVKEKAIVTRLGFVIRSFIETSEAENLAVKFFVTNPLDLAGGNKNHSSSIKYVTNDVIENFNIQNVTQIDVGEDNVTKQKGIALTRDFYMPLESEGLENWNKINIFLNKAWDKQNIAAFIKKLNE